MESEVGILGQIEMEADPAVHVAGNRPIRGKLHGRPIRVKQKGPNQTRQWLVVALRFSVMVNALFLDRHASSSTLDSPSQENVFPVRPGIGTGNVAA